MPTRQGPESNGSLPKSKNTSRRQNTGNIPKAFPPPSPEPFSRISPNSVIDLPPAPSTNGDELLLDFPTSSAQAQAVPSSRSYDDLDDDLEKYATNHTSKKLKSCLSNPNFQSSSTKNTKKSVKFAEMSKCVYIRFKTDKEILQCWYTQDEKEDLQEQTRRAVKLRRRCTSEGDLCRTHNESGRGIEHFASKAAYQKCKQEQDDVIDAVLLLQQHWRTKGLPFNERELAYTSYALSASARDRAYLYGAEDAAAAKAVAGSLLGIGSRRKNTLS